MQLVASQSCNYFEVEVVANKIIQIADTITVIIHMQWYCGKAVKLSLAIDAHGLISF